MLIFGERLEGRAYPDRPAAYGVLTNAPGGLLREFIEETGLKVRPVEVFAEANQLIPCFEELHGYLKICRFYAVELTSPEPVIEARFPTRWLTLEAAAIELEEEVQRWVLEQWKARRPRPAPPLPPPE